MQMFIYTTVFTVLLGDINNRERKKVCPVKKYKRDGRRNNEERFKERRGTKRKREGREKESK